MKKIYIIIIGLIVVIVAGLWLGIWWYLKSANKTPVRQTQDETVNWQKYRRNSPYGLFEIKVPIFWRATNKAAPGDNEPIIVRFEKSADKNDRFPALAIRSSFYYLAYEKSKDFNRELSESNFIDFISYYYQTINNGNSFWQLGITLPTTTLPFLIDNRPAAKIIINKNFKEPIALSEDTWVLFSEKKIILKFSCQLTSEQDEQTMDECDKMIKTFKIIPKAASATNENKKTTTNEPITPKQAVSSESKTTNVINTYNYWPGARWVPGYQRWVCEGLLSNPGCYWTWEPAHYE